MTAAPTGKPIPEPLDSLEVRWIVPGELGSAIRRWFGRFPGETETREDTYLLYPRLSGLSVKLRDGSSLDVKSYLGSTGILELPVGGRLESWRKWSFPYTPEDWGYPAAVGWISVRKRRCTSRFYLSAGRDGVPGAHYAAQAGCAAELTEVEVHGESWWTIGFEATGSADLLRDTLRLAADAVFAQPVPTEIELGLDNSLSYARWLCERSAYDTFAQGNRAKKGALYT
jgi:hypothetical protein